MAKTSTTTLFMSLAAGVLLSTAVLAQAQNCTTRYNPILKQYQTQCMDGTRATERYNDILNRSETTIQYPGGTSQRCTQTYNAILKQWQTRCY